MSRVGGAPITWGVDGSPGWGYLMDPRRVLREMAEIGLHATELGPDGFLPTDPEQLEALLAEHRLALAGGFVPAVLYRREMVEEQLAYIERAAATLGGAGADVLVLGPATHHPGYDRSVDLAEDEWSIFADNLKRVIEIAASHDLTVALHQHWGMAVEQWAHVERVLEMSEVGLCLDTGHFFLAGMDPAEIAGLIGPRVVHVHLKDIDGVAAARVRAGEVGFRQAVIGGIFRPLGEGDIDVESVIRTLEDTGYDRWYILEQDTSLAMAPPERSGPVTDAARSLRYLEELSREI
jgi:inosose dehydratase